MANSAIPPRAVFVMATTLFPSQPSAPSPAASTTPHTSMPRVKGGGVGTETSLPRHRSMSLKLSEAAATATLTSPGLRLGSLDRPHGQDLTRAAVSGHLQGLHVPPPGDTQDEPSSVSHNSPVRSTEPRLEGRDEPGFELPTDVFWGFRPPFPGTAAKEIRIRMNPIDQVHHLLLGNRPVGQRRLQERSDSRFADPAERLDLNGLCGGPGDRVATEDRGVDGSSPDLLML